MPRVLFWLTVIIGLALWTPPSGAQTAGQISGRITDATGAVVPGASITVRSTQRGTARTTASNEFGYYSVQLLEPAIYGITVQSAAFKTVTRSGIKLDVNESTQLDFVLEVGAVSEIGETGAVAMRHRNVWIDSNWLPTISYTMAKRAYKEWLEVVPSDRLLWGGDTTTAEGIYGTSKTLRRCLAEALAEKGCCRRIAGRRRAQDRAAHPSRERPAALSASSGAAPGALAKRESGREFIAAAGAVNLHYQRINSDRFSAIVRHLIQERTKTDLPNGTSVRLEQCTV